MATSQSMVMPEERIRYEQNEYAVQMTVTDEAIMRMTRREEWRDQAQHMAVQAFRYKVFGRRLHSVTYPTTWLDAFKERWIPAWLMRRRERLPWWLAKHLYPSYTTVTSAAFYTGLVPGEIGSSFDVVVSNTDDLLRLREL